jgi:hypothetical protein
VLLRRLLLALATTLIVARPLILGEDAGLSSNLADPWGMVLTLLWLAAAAGWAAWRYWLRPSGEKKNLDVPPSSDWYGGIVDTALLMTVALVFVSAELAAGYKFPARLIAWEWFGLFVSFFVVRQLAVTPEEQRGLFAVLLASAAAVAGQGIYQELAELPSNRRLADDPQAFRAKWAEENPGQDISDSFLEQLRERAKQNNIYGPYAHPNSYAGYLVLWIPALLGVIAVCWRGKAPVWQTALTAGCALLSLAALWLTHSRGAILGLFVSAILFALFVYRRQLRAHALVALIGLLFLIAAGYGAWRGGLLTRGMGKSNNTIAQRLEYWRSTWPMIAERPWLGVGPGNFGENYPRFMPANAEEKIKDPHNFALEMWATCGVFTLAALLATLAGFFYHVVYNLQSERGGVSAPREESLGALMQPRSSETPIRWEFYLGGMFGLLLGFVLRVNTAAPSTILAETYTAALRSVAWFAAYALFERLDWSERGRVYALTMGIVALLLNLCVSGGIGYPSLAGMLWIAVALALNAANLKPSVWLSRAGAARILPLPLFLGLSLGYGVYILYPVLASDDLMREAMQMVDYFHKEAAKPVAERSGGVRDYPARFLQKGVVERLQQAEKLTPDDARISVQLAWWISVIWDLTKSKSERELPLARQALQWGGRATQLDPRGGGGYWVQYHIRIRYALAVKQSLDELRKERGNAEILEAREKTIREQYQLAADTLEKYLPNDPHDTTLHYELARAWFESGDKEKGRRHAEEALTLDDAVAAPTRKLTDRQREQLRKWFPDLSSG